MSATVRRMLKPRAAPRKASVKGFRIVSDQADIVHGRAYARFDAPRKERIGKRGRMNRRRYEIEITTAAAINSAPTSRSSNSRLLGSCWVIRSRRESIHVRITPHSPRSE